MAVYQPTNTIPSSNIGGTIDVNDNMNVSWQVNGNSAMIAFQIDFYVNDYASTPVQSTGRLPDGCPFYGTDRFGRPQFFTWNNDESWNDFSGKFTNANEYKYKITQWYNVVGNVFSVTPSVTLDENNTYYFEISDVGYLKLYTAQEYPANSATFYYNVGMKKSWTVSDNILKTIPMMFLTELPDGSSVVATMEKDVEKSKESFVTQNSFSVFTTRKKPTLNLFQTNADFENPIPFPTELETSIVYFQAKYEQEQGDSIKWIKWLVAEANDGKVGEILEDTGDIYTPTLNYVYNGFFNKQQYAIRCIGESELGQVCDTDWKFFSIEIENPDIYSGEFTAQCLKNEDAVLLKWDAIEVIPASTSPEGYEPVISNGSVILSPASDETEYSITWDNKGKDSSGNNIPLNFQPDWTAVWKAKLQYGDYENSTDITINGSELDKLVRCSAFSPDGKFLIIGGDFSGYASIFSVSGNDITYVGDVTKNGTPLNGSVNCITFSPNKFILPKLYFAIGGNFSGKSSFFSLNYETGQAEYIGDLSTTAIQAGQVNAIEFLDIGGSTFPVIVGGNFSGYASIFSISGNVITYVGDVTKNGTPLNGLVNCISVAYGDLLAVIGGNFTGRASLFRINASAGYTLNYLNDVDKNGVALNNIVRTSNISPNGNLLVLGGWFNGYASLFSISSSGIVTYISDIEKNGIALQSMVNAVSFSSNGTSLAIGEQFGDRATLFSVAGSNISYVYALTNNGSTLDNSVFSIEFSPNNDLIIVGGSFTEKAISISKTYITQGKLLEIDPVQLVVNRTEDRFDVSISDVVVGTFRPTNNITTFSLIIDPNRIYAVGFSGNELAYDPISIPISISNWQNTINSILIYGGEKGATIENVAVYQGNANNIVDLYRQQADFEPNWISDSYKLYMSANFNGNLEGGTGTATGKGFRIYRQEMGKNILTPVATLESNVTSIKDYGIKSRKVYKYYLYAYDANGAFMAAVEANKMVASCFEKYSLLVCDYDIQNDEYHVRKEYLFALNLSVGGVGNNNNPTLNANFTRYPTRMPSTQNYASGTLQGLIGAIYTVPALIEQISNYKYTSKPSTIDYFDNMDLEQEIYDLSTAPYQLFLRDMKGRLRMIATNSAITMTTNIKQKQQPISMSFPWVEIGDASNVTIIQTPDDLGWNNDNQVLDVKLDVDVKTGELSARYPMPYSGTKFYLTGVNQETLTVKTPLGVTPAQFKLSDVAEEQDDGIIRATVMVNREEK